MIVDSRFILSNVGNIVLIRCIGRLDLLSVNGLRLTWVILRVWHIRKEVLLSCLDWSLIRIESLSYYLGST